MKTIDLAKKIPSEYRKEILDGNMIANATFIKDEPNTDYLATIYKNYFETDFKTGCGRCLERLSKAMRNMLPFLIELEKESRLLDEI